MQRRRIADRLLWSPPSKTWTVRASAWPAKAARNTATLSSTGTSWSAEPNSARTGLRDPLERGARVMVEPQSGELQFGGIGGSVVGLAGVAGGPFDDLEARAAPDQPDDPVVGRQAAAISSGDAPSAARCAAVA